MSEKEYFNGKCPYTDKPCDDFECHKCEVEAEEEKYLDHLAWLYDEADIEDMNEAMESEVDDGQITSD